MSKSNLERRLIETGYAALFLYGVHSRANSFWENGTYQQELEEIVYSESGSAHGKFLAAEILRRNGFTLNSRLAGVYTTALQHTIEQSNDPWQLNGNAWAQLFGSMELGPLGEQLLSFGNEAIPHLVPLLDNNGLILYDGSEEASLGNAGRYRVKDFAAFFISKIRSMPFRLAPSHSERDRAIEQLKTAL